MDALMDAAVMHGPGDVRFERVPIPTCPEGGFVLKVEAVGLCGSDIRNLSTDSRKGDYPFIYGHEVVGCVHEVAPGVDGVAMGERLYIYPEAHCLRCENCRSGRSNQCTDVDSYVKRPGGFAEYISYTATRLERGAMYHVPESVDPVRASLAEPLSSTYACVENIDVCLGDTVAILGAGPIGVNLAILSKMRGASKVIVADVNGDRLDRLGPFGVDEVVDGSMCDVVDTILLLTHSRGVDKVISANPSTTSQQQILEITRAGGTAVFFGGVPRGSTAELDTNLIHYKSLWVYGHYGATSIQVQRAFELALDPKYPAESIVSHVLPLARINEAIELTRSGEALKVVLKPTLKEG